MEKTRRRLITTWIVLHYLMVVACVNANIPFYPKSVATITATLSRNKILQIIHESNSPNFQDIIELRGGSDRGYGYSGSGSGGSYNDENDRYGSQNDYHEDDRYGSADRRYKGEHDYESDYYGDKRDYRERDYTPSARKPKSSPLSNMPDVGGILRNGNKKIGFMLLGGGLVFTMLGISLFFNKTLMRLGNILFILGVPMTIGPGRTTGYFLQPKKSRATGCLGLGIFLVFIGWPIVGIALEIFGLLNLFGNMFPVFMVILKQMPVVGSLLNGNKRNGKKSGGGNKSHNQASKSANKYSYDDEEEYYRDEDEEDSGYRERYY